MEQLSQELYSYFTAQPSFTDIVANRLFPLVAYKDVSFPFAVYRIAQQEGETKDADRFNVSLSVFFKENEYTECARFADTIKNIVENSRYNWQDSEIDFVEEDRSMVATITFVKN